MYVINLRKSNKTVKVSHKTDIIKVSHISRPVVVKRVGLKGDTGIGMPAGGQTDQILVKASNDDYDFMWADGNLSDKHFRQDFSVTSEVTVTHSLAKLPAVTVLDSAGDVVEGTVNHINNQQLTVTFTAPFSGTVFCN